MQSKLYYPLIAIIPVDSLSNKSSFKHTQLRDIGNLFNISLQYSLQCERHRSDNTQFQLQLIDHFINVRLPVLLNIIEHRGRTAVLE